MSPVFGRCFTFGLCSVSWWKGFRFFFCRSPEKQSKNGVFWQGGQHEMATKMPLRAKGMGVLWMKNSQLKIKGLDSLVLPYLSRKMHASNSSPFHCILLNMSSYGSEHNTHTHMHMYMIWRCDIVLPHMSWNWNCFILHCGVYVFYTQHIYI